MIARGRPVALLPIVLVLGCARTVPVSPPSTDTSTIADAISADAGGQHADEGSLDARLNPPADGGQVRRLSCEAPEPVGAALENHLFAPAMRADGLMVRAEPRDDPPVYATRATLDASFGSWTASTMLPVDAQDPTFFLFDGQERTVIAVEVQAEPYLRGLQYCASVPAASCTAVTVVDDALGTTITQDMDGPSVAVVDGAQVMVFNVSIHNVGISANVFQATPTVAGDLRHWTAEPLSAISRPNLREDDPAVSADGTIVVYERPVEGRGDDLWVAYRASPSAPLSVPESLEALNTEANDGSPEIFQLNDGEIELYFNSQRLGERFARIYRSRCTREPVR